MDATEVDRQAEKPFLCFGEILLRLTPSSIVGGDSPGWSEMLGTVNSVDTVDRLSTQRPDGSPDACFEAWWGGSEANVAVGLARLGRTASLLTSLPKNPLGKAARENLRQHGVDLLEPKDQKALPGNPGNPPGTDRLGLYFAAVHAAGKEIFYDRTGSLFSLRPPQPRDVTWENFHHFHTSGINPALSNRCLQTTLELLQTAKRRGLGTSFDLNLRRRLWSDPAAGRVIREMLPHIDQLFAHASQLTSAFALPKIDCDQPEEASRVVRDFCQSTGVGAVIVTNRDQQQAPHTNFAEKVPHPNRVRLKALLVDSANTLYRQTPWFEARDRIGSGDALCAGVLAAATGNASSSKILEFGLAAASLANQTAGDFPLFSPPDVENQRTVLFGCSAASSPGRRLPK